MMAQSDPTSVALTTNTTSIASNDHQNKNTDEPATPGDEMKPSLGDACKEMFQKTADYLQCELNASLDDYELLEKLNQITKQKYSEMDNVTKSLISKMEEINEKYEKLKPFLEMVDKVDASVTNLAEAAHKLDAYSKELESRFKKLEKAAS